MSKLIVLSEIDCLTYLLRTLVKPNEYYTDFEEFSNHVAHFTDTTVVIILGGACVFGKRRVLDLYKMLSLRADDESDTGINDVYLLSDICFPTCEEYYFFENEPTLCREYSYLKQVGNPVAVLSSIEHEEPESIQVHLSVLSSGDKYVPEKRDKTKLEIENDALLDLIKVPTLS